MAFIHIITHLHALQWEPASLWIHISSLHLSLWPAAWVTFNEDELQLPLFLAATRVSWMLHVSCVLSFCLSISLNPHSTSFESSLLFTLRSLGSSLFRSSERTCASVVVCGRACFSFFVSNSVFVSRVKVVRSAKERVGDKIRSLTLRVSSCLPTLKTTVPWF